MNVQQLWLPDQPYSYQRTFDDTSFNDKLVVTPVQFRATTTKTGWLRRFAQMVFEVTYVDPERAQAATLNDTTPPVISNVSLTPIAAIQSVGTAAAKTIQVSATVQDTGGSPGPLAVNVLFSPDGRRIVAVPLTRTTGNQYQGTVQTSLSNPNAITAIEARDGAGNVATQALKGTLSSAFVEVNLPLVVR
jgi:hypothetical protein